MSPIKSDQDIRQAARQLGVDEKMLRDLFDTPYPDELLQRAARLVADDDKELGEVARIFGVNQNYLGKAVWYLKENRAREKDELLQRAARAVVDDHKEIADAARTFGVNEKHLGEAVWYMKKNRQGEPDERLRSAALTVIYRNVEVRTVAASYGVSEEQLRRAVAEKKREAEEIAERARIDFQRRMQESPPS